MQENVTSWGPAVVAVVAVMGIVANAAVAHWRVGAMSKDIEALQGEMKELEGVKAKALQEHVEFNRRLEILEDQVFKRRTP